MAHLWAISYLKKTAATDANLSWSSEVVASNSLSEAISIVITILIFFIATMFTLFWNS